MRRYVQILGLVVLTFAASGWGSVVAAVLCPHANIGPSAQGTADIIAPEQACHKAKPVAAEKPHCHDSDTGQEAAAAKNGMDTPPAMPAAAGSSSSALTAHALRQNLPCTHCLSRPEAPASTVMARQQAERKRSFEPITWQAITLAVPEQSFRKTVLYRQGAPPGPPTPKHLLTGVLLI